MNDQLWHDFYRLGVRYAHEVGNEPDRLQPDAIWDAVREQITALELIEDSYDAQALHYAFRLGVLNGMAQMYRS